MEKHFHRTVSAWVAVDLAQKTLHVPTLFTTGLGVLSLVLFLVIIEHKTKCGSWLWRKVCKLA